MPDRVSVTSAEFVRNFGYWQEQALHRPLSITHHGRERLVLASSERFRELGGEERRESATPEAMTALSATLDNIAQGFFVLDRDYRVLRINRVAADCLGVAREGLEGRVLTETYPVLKGGFVIEQVDRVFRSGEPVDFETPSPIFPERLVEVRMFPYPGGVATLWTNRTEERRVQARLERASAWSDALIANPSVATMSLDDRGRIQHIGGAATEWTGFAPEQLHGVRLGDIIVPRSRRAVADLVEAVLAGGASQTAAGLAIVARGGAEIALDVTVAAVRAGPGVSGACLLFTRAASQEPAKPKRASRN